MKTPFSSFSMFLKEYRRTLGLAASLFVVSLRLLAQTPIAHYPLNGNANDVSGNGFNGTIQGTVTPISDRNGNPNSAMQFGGSGQVDIGANLADQNFSISMWLKPGSTQNQFADIMDNNHTGFQNWVLQQDGNTLNRYVFGVHRSSGGIGIFFNLQTDVWQHLVLVKSATTLEAYINGVLDQTTAWDGTVNYVSPFFRLGNWANGGRNWYGGMDEVKYFNTALNQSQVTTLFNEGTVQPIAYYPFSGNANDAVGSLNGTVNGATLTTDRFGNPNSAYSFDGVNDFIGLNHNFGPFTELTVSAWYKVTATSPDLQAIVSSDASGKFLHMQISTSSDADNAVYFNPGPSNLLLSHPQPTLNQWRQVTITAKSGESKLYIDGVLVDTKNSTFSSITVTDLLRIGSGFQNGRFFNGAIDEVKIYNTALSGTQVLAEFNGSSSGAQQKPGSGNAISFDGVNDVITIPNGGALNGLQTGTIEMWVKWNGTNQPSGQGMNGAVMARQSDGQFSNQIIGLSGPDPNTAGIVWRPYLATSSAIVSLVSPGEKWNHLAITYSSGSHILYLNGIQVGSGSNTGTISSSDVPLGIGRWLNGGGFGANADIDELRIWNTALTQAQIRDRMCRKITSGDALFSNLVAYYNYDETSGNTAFDGTANANNGTLTNGPTRVTSGAAIGNASAHNYVSSGFPSANLSLNGQDNLGVAYNAGTFSGTAGTHIYAVSEKPNTEVGIENPGSNDRYFGVFNAGLTNPQYTATYNYTGNGFVTAGNESQLALFKRNDNAATTWANANATLNTGANTLTATGQSTEYVLGVANCVTPPTPTISAGGPTTFCTGGSVVLTSSAATGNVWSNGATTQSITVNSAGSFTVQVILAGCSSAVSAATNVVVNTPPAAAVITSPSGLSFCSGSSLTLQSDQSTLQQWQRNGSNFNGQTGPSLLVSTPGTYTAVRTQNGCSATSNALVITENTNVPATPTISSGGQTSFCANASLGLLSSATEGNQWIRNGTDINGATSNTFTATQTGTYAVRVTIGGCSKTSANLVLTTLPAPTVNISTSAPGICPSIPVVLSTTGTALSAREWLKDGSSTGQFGTTFSASVAGSYTVIGTAANGCQTTSSALNVQADLIPELTSNKPANTICSGNSITLTSSPGASFLWNTGATTSSITVSPANTGNFSVQTTGALGCVFNNAITVTVVPTLTPAQVSNMLPDNGSINQENSITFSWQPATNAIAYDLYVWPAPGVRPGTPNANGITNISAELHNLNFGTLYNYQVVSRSACQTTDGPVQQFTTRNLPDLVVSNVVYPNSRTAPGTVRVAYTVQNIGLGMTLPATWTERLYISLDSVLDAGDQVIATTQNLTGLLPGQSYNREISVTLSDDKSGAYFLFVRVNDGNTIFETSTANNFASGNPGKINITLNNTLPDLTAGGPIGVPPIAIGGTLMAYNFDILNSGSTLAEGTDGPLVDVSVGLNLPNFAQPILTCINNNSFTLQLKSWWNSVYLSKDTIFNPATAVKIGLVEVVPKRERPFTGTSCEDFEFFPNGLPAGEHLVKSGNVLLPPSANGKHFLHIVMNDYLPFVERSRSNNVISSAGFEVILQPPADIRLVSGNLGGPQAIILKPISLQYQVQNIGSNTARDWFDRIFVSKSAVFNNSARLLQTFELDSLAVGQSYTKNTQLRIPAEFEGSAFIHIRTGIGLFEHTFTENNNLVIPVTVSSSQLPDLKILSFSALNQPTQNEPVVFRIKVKNTGNASTFVRPIDLRLTASKTAAFNPISIQSLASVLVDSLGINDEQTLDVPAIVPAGFSGQVFFRASLDEGNVQPESNESNNNWFSVYGGPGPGGTGGNPVGTGSGNSASDPFVAGLAVVPGPQLDGKIRSMSFTSPAQSGFETTIKVKVEPISNQIGLPFTATLQLSVIDPANPDQPVASTSAPILIGDTTTKTVAISLNFGPQIQGNFTLQATLDLGVNQFRDSEPANNQVSQTISLLRPLLPDLVILSAEVPANLQCGAFFKIPIVVKNQGPGVIQAGFEQRAFLANSPSGSPVVSAIGGGSNINVLAPGTSKNDTIVGFVPNSISGNFFLVIRADANASNFEGETGELNNTFIQNIVVVPPSPIDLVTESVSLPSSFTLGRNVNGSLICRNLGPGQAIGSIQNFLGVSKGLQFNPETDSRIGLKMASINLLANGTSLVTFRGNANGILPGSYKGFGQVNTQFSLPETNFLNNSGVSAQNLSVQVNNLSLDQNTEVSNMELDEIAYFKLNATAGLDLVVNFSGTDAFASFEKVPTEAISDFRPVLNTARMVIPSTQAGNYYLGVKPFSQLGTVKANILVKAVPFGVSLVSPTLVGAGPVSTYLTGGGFTEGSVFEAFRGTTLVATGTILELYNSMEAKVKWNFTGVALGPVTIKVRKQGAVGVTEGSLTLEAPRVARLFGERNGSSRTRANTSSLQNFQFFNDGNVDIEYAMGIVTFPGLAQAKSISASENALFLGKLHEKAGIRANKMTKQTYFDVFVQIPVFYKDLGPGEQFSVQFKLDNFGGVTSLPIARQGFNLSRAQFMRIMAEEIEKVRFATKYQPNSFLASVHRDSAFSADKFRRAAIRSLVASRFISQAMANQYFATNYRPDFALGNFQGYGIVRFPEQMIQRSALTVLGKSFVKSQLPQERNLTPFITGNVMATYSPLFFMPLTNYMNQATLNGFLSQLIFQNSQSILLSVVASINPGTPTNVNLAGNRGGGIVRRSVFGPVSLFYRIRQRNPPNFPPFPVPPANLLPPNEAPGNAWAPFVEPPFIPQKPVNNDRDPADIEFDIDFDNATCDSCGPNPEDDREIEFGEATMTSAPCNPIPPEQADQGLEDCILEGDIIGDTRCGSTYQLCFFSACTFDPLLFAGDCEPEQTVQLDYDCIDVQGSCDPNEIVGPSGYGESRMVAKSKSLDYTIKFENDPKLATAAAQNVRIVQPLDPNFKQSGFALGSFGFGNQEFSIPAGQNTFSTQLDFTAEKGIKVNVAAALDVPGKRLIWSFSTIDAFTGLPSSNPESGFLPVNDSTGKGEGFVKFVIRAGDATITGDSLRAQADIFFDFNEPIKTNRHFNIVDALPPTTTVLSPSGSQDSTKVRLLWTALDDVGGSGWAKTFVQVKQDGAPIDTLEILAENGGNFLAGPFATNHEYQFFFQSADHVGNLEALPASPNMTVTIGGTPCNDPAPTVSAGGPTTFCQGGSVVLTSNKPSGNVWSNGETTQSITISASGSFTVKTVIEGCTSAVSAPTLVTVNPLPPKPTITASGPLSFCQGGFVQLTTNAAIGHKWNTGATTASITVTTSGIFADTAIAMGCKNVSDPVVVTVNPKPTVFAGEDVSIEAGSSAVLTASGALTYQWSPLVAMEPANGVGETVTVSPTQTTLYTVTGTDANDCSNTDQVLVTVTGGSGPLTTPVITPGTGTYPGPQTVSITTTSVGAEIYYTTNGNVPVLGTVFTKQYTGPFQVLQTGTVRAMAVRTGQANSAIAVAFLTITSPGICAAPQVSPAAGTYEGSATVSMSTATEEGEIWYTTNGNNPRFDIPNSFTKRYVSPFVIYANTQIRAITIKAGLVNSPITTVNYTLTAPAIVATPTFSPLPGTYGSAQSITLSTTTPEAQIYYTTNGNVPRLDVPNSFTKLYTGPFLLSQSATIRAIAVRTGWLQSGTAVGIYTFGGARSAVAEVTEVGEGQAAQQFHLFPNPNSGRFQILTENVEEETEISIQTTLGQTIWEGKIEQGQNQLEVDISRQPAGIYSVRINSGSLMKELRVNKY